MRIVESFQDVELYLRSTDLVNEIIDTFGKNFYNERSELGEVSDFVVDSVIDKFGVSITGERVIVCKVVDEDIDLIDTDHYVVNYNGTYYDYCAQKFNDSFNGLIKTTSVPVVQQIIHSDKQINDKLSSVKGYVILGY